jgi:general secretion pathway protein G
MKGGKVCGDSRGLTLIELIITVTILGILAGGILPMLHNTAVRTKEIELRRNLRIIRIAIDDYKKTFDKMPDGPLKSGNGYPKDLQELIEGRDFGDVKSGSVKFLRRPVPNPLALNSSDDSKWGWELRCYKDKPSESTWCGDDVFDVYAPQNGVAMDGSRYNQW